MVVRLKALPRRAPLRCRSRHEPLDRAAGDLVTFPLHLGPDLVGPIDVEVVRVDLGDLRLEFLVADPAGTRWPPLGGVVGPGSELQRGADRLDSPATLARIDVADYFFGRPSSSVAKKIEASFNISLARRSSLTSFSRSFSFWRSSVVSPGRTPFVDLGPADPDPKRLGRHPELGG